MREVPVFPFTASFVTTHNGAVLAVENENDLQALSEVELVAQKIKSIDDKLPVRRIDPSMDQSSKIEMFFKL